MTSYLLGLAIFLLSTLVAGLYRVFRGPAAADRMLAAQLFGTTGVAILLVLSELLERPAILDVALVASLLAVVGVVAFVQPRTGREGEG